MSAEHVSDERLAAYWLGELDEPAAAALEEHVFECDVCAQACSGMQRVIAGVRALLPPVISSERLRALRAETPALKQVEVEPGGSATVEFGPGDQLFVIRLQADLARAERVDVSFERPGGGTLIECPDAPFDADEGAVTVVCQRHFMERGYPRVLTMRVRAVRDGHCADAGVYAIAHVVSV